MHKGLDSIPERGLLPQIVSLVRTQSAVLVTGHIFDVGAVGVDESVQLFICENEHLIVSPRTIRDKIENECSPTSSLNTAVDLMNICQEGRL